MYNFLSILHKIFPLSANVALTILMRIGIVSLLSSFHENYQVCASHILVILGILNLTYFFSIGSSLRMRSYKDKIKEEGVIVILSSLTLNFILSFSTLCISYFAIFPILTLFKQPFLIVQYTSYFFKCFSFSLIPTALFQSIQQILIGMGYSYLVILVNFISHGSTIVSLYILKIYVNHHNLDQKPLLIPFEIPFLMYGILGMCLLGSVLFYKKIFSIQLTLPSYQTYKAELKTLFKISFPFCIQNIHGNLVHFVHILLVGRLVPHLLVAYHIFMQYNLMIFILVLGGVQAFGLDIVKTIEKRNKEVLLKKIVSYAKVFLIFMSILGIFYFFKITHHIDEHHYSLITRYDLWMSYCVAVCAYTMFLVRNSSMIILTYLGFPMLPSLLSTVMSLGIGIPLSIFFSYSLSYSLTGIHLGTIFHYSLTTIIVLLKIKQNWAMLSKSYF